MKHIINFEDGQRIISVNNDATNKQIKEKIIEWMDSEGIEHIGYEEVMPLNAIMKSLAIGFGGEDLSPDVFPADTIASKLNLEGVLKDSSLHELILNLNHNNGRGGIMECRTICDHDDAIMCEHRLQWIVDFIKNHMNDKF